MCCQGFVMAQSIGSRRFDTIGSKEASMEISYDMRELIYTLIREALEKFLPFKEGYILAAIPPAAIAIEKHLDYLDRRYADKNKLLFTPNRPELDKRVDETIDPADTRKVQKLYQNAAKYEGITVLAPTLKLMEAVAAGSEEEPLPNLILYYLLHGKAVEMVVDFSPEGLPVSSFSRRVREQFAKLADMGVRFVNAEDSCVEGTDPDDTLITMEVVEKLHQRGDREIVLTDNKILTPLARDRAEELHIRIREA